MLHSLKFMMKYEFDILHNRCIYITLVQLMETVGNIIHSVTIAVLFF